jgi:hypothetical protein
MFKSLWIAIDFDGTCITNDWPKKGKDIGAVPVLKKLVNAGHRLILYTCRANHEEDRQIEDLFMPAGNHLQEAIDWFDNNNIELSAINFNPDEADAGFNFVEKIHFDLLIDDKALGVPLVKTAIINDKIVTSDRPFVSWYIIEDLLKNRGII